jgi:hypothetical protein
MSNEIMNLNDLRDFLANELKRVAKGESTPATANASANLAGKILSSVKLELEYNKMVGTAPKIDFIKINKIESKKLTNK